MTRAKENSDYIIRTSGLFILFSRRFSAPITKFLEKTRISPNQVSYFSLLFEFVAACFIVTGKYPYLVLAAVLLYFSLICDLVDGELARLRGTSGVGGKWLDVAVGELGNLVSASAFGLGLYNRTHDNKALFLLAYFLISKYAYANITINSQVQVGGYDNFKKYALDPLYSKFNRLMGLVRKKGEADVVHYNYGKKIPSVGIFILIPLLGLLLNQPALVLVIFSLIYTTLYLLVFLQMASSFNQEAKEHR